MSKFFRTLKRKHHARSKRTRFAGGGREGLDGRRLVPPRMPHVRWNAVQSLRRDPARSLRSGPPKEGWVDSARSPACGFPRGVLQVNCSLAACASGVACGKMKAFQAIGMHVIAVPGYGFCEVYRRTDATERARSLSCFACRGVYGGRRAQQISEHNLHPPHKLSPSKERKES